MDDIKTILCGGTAGALGFISTLPLDYAKQHLQGGENLYQIKQIVKREGPKVLFRGGTVGLKVIVPQMAIKFYSYKTYNQYTNNHLLSSFCAGFTDGFFLGPPLMIQALMQTKEDLSYKQAKKIVINRHLFRYCFPMAMRNGAYTSSTIGLSKYITDKYQIKGTPLNVFGMTMLLNPIGVITCSPWDVIRAKQAYEIANSGNAKVINIAKNIYRNNGLRGFYAGGNGLFINFALRFPLTFAINAFLMMHF